MSETNILIFSLLGGIIPAFFWLWFWLKEDRLKPEPKLSLLSAFISGIMALFLALFFELIIYYLLADANIFHLKCFPEVLQNVFQNLSVKYNLSAWQNSFWQEVQDFFSNSPVSFIQDLNLKKGFLVIIVAPFIEELFKLLLVYNICLRRKVNDEPVDPAIYLLTAALGFAAIETTMFLVEPLNKGYLLDSFVAGNFRSIGPMLIHLVSSTLLGIFIGLAFYKSKIKKFFYLTFGFILAVFLHAIFNFFIILNDTTHQTVFFWVACFGTWFMIIVLLLAFSKVKKVTNLSDK